MGKHARRRLPGGRITAGLLIASGILLLGAGGTAYAAYRYDRAHAAEIMPGVRIADVEVGGLTRAQATAAVRASADRELARRLEVTAGERTWHRTAAELGMTADVTAAVDQAFDVAGSMSLLSRVLDRWQQEQANVSIELEYRFNRSPVEGFVERAAKAVYRQPVDASVGLESSGVVFTRAEAGRALQERAGVLGIREALLKDLPAVRIPTEVVRPEVSTAELGYTIVVNKSENMLYVYRAMQLDRSYPVATAASGYDTPTGMWEVINKSEDPTWYNPAPDGWGAGEPLEIPPGPGNPLGTRALYLDAPGIRIHGTYSSDSIGTYASHGCIRMYIEDSEELYPIIPIGTTVIIH